MASKQWIIYRATEIPGKVNKPGCRWRMYGVEEGEVLESTSDPSFRNWHSRGWGALNEDPCPWGVYENIHEDTTRKTNQGVGVANADYRPVLTHRLDSQQQAEDFVRELCKSAKPKKFIDNTFDNLFE